MSFILVATLIPVLFIVWRYIDETRHLDLTALDRLAMEYEVP